MFHLLEKSPKDLFPICRLKESFVVKACFIGLSFVCRSKTWKGSQDVKYVPLLKQELDHAVVIYMPTVVNSCCWQLFK